MCPNGTDVNMLGLEPDGYFGILQSGRCIPWSVYYSNLTTNLKVLKMLSVHPSKGLKGAMLKHSAQWPDPSSDPSAICS